MSINQVFLTGNLTKSPELRQTASGSFILNFSIAVNERVRNANTGEWEDRPNYFDCAMFGQRASSLVSILRKGMKVGVAGKLRWSQWEKDGEKRSSISIVVDEIELMSQRKDADHSTVEQASSMSVQPHVANSIYDEDVPF